MVKEFDPQKDRIDRLILEQVLNSKTKVIGGGLVDNSATNYEPGSFKEDPGPNYGSLLWPLVNLLNTHKNIKN